MNDTLTLSQAQSLALLIGAVQRSATVRYFWDGIDEYPARSMSRVLRAFTKEGGGFWFDSDGDIRDAFVWASGTTEEWWSVRTLVEAITNNLYPNDTTAPMLAIE